MKKFCSRALMSAIISVFAIAILPILSNAAAVPSGFQNMTVKGAASFGTTSAADSKAVVDMVSTSKGFLPPRMTTAQRTAIASPPTGLTVYDTDLVSLYQYNGSAWTAVGSGSGNGTGSVEYIRNPDAETATTGWATYSDASASSPVDGTGGTASSLTFTRTTTSGEVIRGTASFKLAKAAANAQGQGGSYDFTIDAQDKYGPVYISFDYTVSANFANGDVKVFVYDKDAAAVVGVVDSVGSAGALPASSTRFTGVFNPTTTTSRNYRLIFHVATTNALAYTFIYDNVHTGGANLVPGAIVTSTTSFTATGSWTTNATYTANYSRIGDKAYGKIYITLSGAPNAATALTLNFIPGLTVDTSKFPVTPARHPVGRCEALSTNAYTFELDQQGQVMEMVYQNSVSAQLVAVSTTAPVTWASGNTIACSFWDIPVVGWSAGAQLSTGEMLQQTAAPLTASSSIKTPAASSQFHSLGGNSVTLSAGTYDLSGTCNFDSNGASFAGYSDTYCSWFSANGADTGSVPSGLSATANLTLLSGTDVSRIMPNSTPYVVVPAQARRVKCASSCTVYLGTYAVMTTAANARISVQITASRVPDFTVFGVAPISPTLVKYLNTAGTSLPATSTTGIPFVTRTYDANFVYNGSTLTCQIPGKYKINVVIVTAANTLATTGTISIQLFKNSSFYEILGGTAGNGASVGRAIQGATTVPLAIGDTIDIRAYTDAATSLINVAGYNHLEIERVGD